MRNSALIAAAALALLPTMLPAADFVCDRSESRSTPSPDGRWTANVQEEVCETATGVAAGVTVNLVPDVDPERATRVFIMPVPRSRDDWARIRWLGPDAMEIRVPNLSEPTSPQPEHEGIRISLAFCGDNPEHRALLSSYRAAVKEWQNVVSAWVKMRNEDPAKAGPRPPRPEEPKLPHGRCVD